MSVKPTPFIYNMLLCNGKLCDGISFQYVFCFVILKYLEAKIAYQKGCLISCCYGKIAVCVERQLYSCWHCYIIRSSYLQKV